MVAKAYDWEHGATLDDHSRRKHKILREYFHQYLMVRCQHPAQTRFRLAVVDGFSGAGRYKCGSAGSPIIFIEELQRAVEAVNLKRAAQGLNSTVEVECLLIFNDYEEGITEILKAAAGPVVAAARESCPKLHLNVCYLSDEFETSYPLIKQMIVEGRYRNVLFNLDQCGHSKVQSGTLGDIMTSTDSAEIFYTFSIKSLLAYLSRTDPELLSSRFRPIGVDPAELLAMHTLSNPMWLGAAERLVFESFRRYATFVSPFSIANPDGWRYWLIHFANNYRARQVYNDVLHGNGTQAHFGRSGLNMLSYNPQGEGQLYLFDGDGRQDARTHLLQDIPRLISETGDTMNVAEFYGTVYNHTPAHKDDIHAAMIDSGELEVITESGGLRRKASAIEVGDTIKLKTQRSFFPVFFKPPPQKIGK